MQLKAKAPPRRFVLATQVARTRVSFLAVIYKTGWKLVCLLSFHYNYKTYMNMFLYSVHQRPQYLRLVSVFSSFQGVQCQASSFTAQTGSFQGAQKILCSVRVQHLSGRTGCHRMKCQQACN